ncbi:MAG: HugZ family protein [Turicibacter sp.]
MEKLLEQKSMMISSMNGDNIPEISYAPFMMKDNKIYIYLSRAANHYHNLIKNPDCSVMMIQDEQDATNIFARNRVSYQCVAKKLEVIDEAIVEQFSVKHDQATLKALKKLDFEWFELTIVKGRLVLGFGKAFEITIENEEVKLTQVMGMGHK